jgi:long-chain acyl-CoA synthetase
MTTRWPQGGTLTQLFLEAVDRFGDAQAFGRITPELGIEAISYADVLSSVRSVTAGLEALGLERGDRAAILSHNRLEWALADYGCLCAGVTVVPIYPTLPVPQVASMLDDAAVKVVFVPDASQLAKAVEARTRCGTPFRIIVFDPPRAVVGATLTWETFIERGRADARQIPEQTFREGALAASPNDVATMLYTSGTTGDPKGVMLTHGNVASNVRAILSALAIHDTDSSLSFLPLAHIFQRTADYSFFTAGCTIVHARRMVTAVRDMRLVRPTVVAAVPRVYEKIFSAVTDARGYRRELVRWAVGVADRVARMRERGRVPFGIIAAQRAVADRLLFRRLREAVGGRIRFFVSGSAPLATELSRFFHSVGLRILEGYGLTETSPVISVNTLDDSRVGTVGKALPGTEIRIAEDGEILVRGPQIMKGYHGRPEATAEAIDPEGWFHTGDIGELDEDGFLRITDRKKDLIVTAGGKNIAPQPLENRIKLSPFIEHAVMVGDRRKFPSVLIVPAFDALEAWAAANELRWTSRDELIALPMVRERMSREVKDRLEGLASYQTPKKVALLAEDFTVADGSLTPTLSIRRRAIQERFSVLIDELYDPGGGR